MGGESMHELTNLIDGDTLPEHYNLTFPEYKISNCAPVPMEGIFPHAKASRVPERLSLVPALAALTKQAPGFCRKPRMDYFTLIACSL